jgi:hypothetical protein
MPLRTVAKGFEVPKTTLLYKCKGKYPAKRKMGPETIFTQQEESLIVTWIQNMAKSGFPISKDNFLNSVSELLKKLNKPFANSIPVRTWYQSFLRRHPDKISLRTPQNLTRRRYSVSKQQERKIKKLMNMYCNKIAKIYWTIRGECLMQTNQPFFFEP